MDASHDQPVSRAVRLRLRLLFTAVIAGFVVNAWWTAATGVEPYPTLLMPSFRGSPCDAEGAVHVLRMEIIVTFADGAVERLPPTQVLPDVLGPALRGIMQHQFRDFPPRPAPPPPDHWRSSATRRLRSAVAPGYVLGRLRRETWAGVSPEARAWMWRRVQQYSGDRPIAAIAVDWSVEYYAGREPDWRITRKPLTRVEVPR